MSRIPLNRRDVEATLNEWPDVSQIVNTDVDGLLSAALLWERKRWPIVGFYDTERLWVSSAALSSDGKLNLDRVVFVDIDMCWPGTRSLSQHVVCRSPREAGVVEAFSRTLNPNLCAGISWENYTPKYPFGTFQWLHWILGEPPPSPADVVQTGLMWMPDGGFVSAQGHWATNCRRWATELLPGCGLEPLFADSRTSEARDFVLQAMEWVIDASLARRHVWRNLQYVASVRKGTTYDVLADPLVEAERVEIERILFALSSAFGWTAPVLPTDWKVFRGEWASRSTSDPKMVTWSSRANQCEIVSCAFIDRKTFAYTRPRRVLQPGRDPSNEPHLGDVLPQGPT